MDPELISGLIRKTVLCIEYLDLEIGKKGTTSSFFRWMEMLLFFVISTDFFLLEVFKVEGTLEPSAQM